MRDSLGDEEDAPRRGRAESALVDVVIASMLAVGVFVVHPISYVFHRPFWLDEAWVATLARGPLSRAVALSSSTPIGWLLLVRLVPGGRGEQLRLVPLLFSAGEVAVAYLLASCLPWGSRTFSRAAGTAAGVVVLLAPVSLLRNDLKQYTADAFFALAILVLANRVEGTPSRRTTWELAAVSIVALPFSTTAAFVVAAVYAGLFCAAVAARAMERARSVALSGGCVAVVTAAYFAVVVVPHTNASLRTFWDAFYLPSSPGRLLSVSWNRFVTIAPALGLPAILTVGLFIGGCVVLVRLGRPGLASALALLWVEMIIMGMVHRYPFLDLRTSTFLLVVSLVTIVIGVLGLVRVLTPRWRVLSASMVLLVTFTFLHGSIPYVRVRSIPDENVRSAVEYIARQRRDGDVIVVTLPSSYGFGYYWPDSEIQFRKDDAASTGFITRVRGLRDVVYVGGLTSADTTQAMRSALRQVHQGGRGARIWIVRTHLYRSEALAWQHTFRALNLHPTSKKVGPESIWTITGTKPAAA